METKDSLLFVEALQADAKQLAAQHLALHSICQEHVGCIKIIRQMVKTLRAHRAIWHQRMQEALIDSPASASAALVCVVLDNLLTLFADGPDPLCAQGVILKPLEAVDPGEDADEDENDGDYDRDPSHLKEPIS